MKSSVHEVMNKFSSLTWITKVSNARVVYTYKTDKNTKKKNAIFELTESILTETIKKGGGGFMHGVGEVFSFSF